MFSVEVVFILNLDDDVFGFNLDVQQNPPLSFNVEFKVRKRSMLGEEIDMKPCFIKSVESSVDRESVRNPQDGSFL